ncbi:MAG: PDZ domain-containing protein [Acidimicrobiales bacterium]
MSIVGMVLAAMALVGLGIGVGYSTWGTTQATSASGGSATPLHPVRPVAPGTSTSTGAGGATAKNEAFLGVDIAETSALPSGSTSATTSTGTTSTSTGTTSTTTGTTSTTTGSNSTSTGPSQAEGARVVGVVSTSPAAKAGIQKGDVITDFATQRVVNALTLEFDVEHSKVGQTVAVSWTSTTGKKDHATVTLTTRSAANRSIG